MKSPCINIFIKPVVISILICLSQCLFAQINSDRNIGSFILPINPGDPVSKLHLRKISISGNKKTKDYIILREMQVKAGDSILLVNLNTELEKARQHIYNTTLFVEVAVEPIIISAFDFDIKIIVKERWYIFPLPELQIVDGTLNEWLIKYKGDLDRLNYGIKFTHFNLTGRKDQLRIHLLNGYTRTISINYSNPYSNAALTNGFSVGAGYFQNRETAYKTSYDNEIVFYKRNDFVRYAWEIQLG